jgi:very-short-patch-repair endonuclease
MLVVPDVARAQGGVFTRQQARDAGFSAYQIRERVRRGVWRPLGPAAFCLAATELDHRGAAFAAGLSTRAVVSHWSAALMHGLGVPDPAPSIVGHVTSSRPLHINVPGVREHRLRLFTEHVVETQGLRVTSVPRTVVDLLALIHRQRAETLLFRAVQQNWLDESTLREFIRNRSGWHGTPQLRELAALLGTGAHAVPERRLHAILDRAGIRYRANVSIQLPHGGRAIADIWIEGTRVLIEVDGRRFHSDAETFQSDRERQNALVNAGYTVLRFTWLDITQREAEVLATIRRQLPARSA